MGSSTAAAEQTGYTVSAVARRLGVAAATLRTWDRRYGISPSLRTAGSHRRYTVDDITVLERMHGLMMAGMPPGDAARASLASDSEPEREVAPPPDNVLPLRKGSAEQRGLERAASSMDTNAAADLIRRSIDRNGVTWTWDEVVAPVLRTVGAKFAAAGDADGEFIDIEHHLSHVVIRELIRQSEVRHPANPRPVLLASAPEEQHTLPLFALAAALAERGISARILGGRTPDEALAAAVRRTGPSAVFVWAQTKPCSDLRAAVPVTRPAAAVIAGGPGWADIDLPPGVGRPRDLNEAVALVAAAARPSQAWRP